MSLDGQVALVTGGARGIGRAIAERVAEDGADVALADVRESELAEAVRAVEALGRRALGLTVDVTDRAAVERMVETTVRELGAVDMLFNNAGIIKVHDFLDIEDEDFDRIMAVNTKGVFLCGQVVARHMVERGRGKIVNTASIAARLGIPDSAAYAASKAAVMSLTRSMAAALATTGVTVNALAPGMVDTDMWALIDEQTAKLRGMEIGEPKRRRVRRVPTGRAATARDIAAVAGFLASAASDHMNGQTLNIDGGEVMS
jgi:NAD(P)-dependent dehydrogenase (short-subunit alcohol dehydrogenase family)